MEYYYRQNEGIQNPYVLHTDGGEFLFFKRWDNGFYLQLKDVFRFDTPIKMTEKEVEVAKMLNPSAFISVNWVEILK